MTRGEPQIIRVLSCQELSCQEFVYYLVKNIRICAESMCVMMLSVSFILYGAAWFAVLLSQCPQQAGSVYSLAVVINSSFLPVTLLRVLHIDFHKIFFHFKKRRLTLTRLFPLSMELFSSSTTLFPCFQFFCTKQPLFCIVATILQKKEPND